MHIYIFYQMHFLLDHYKDITEYTKNLLFTSFVYSLTLCLYTSHLWITFYKISECDFGTVIIVSPPLLSPH